MLTRRNMMRIINFSLLILTAITLSGCPTNSAYELFLGYEADKNEFELGDLQVDLWYGISEKYRDKLVSDDRTSYDKVYIFMTNGSYSGRKTPFDPTDPSVYMIREIPMTEFFTDEYLQDNNRGRVIYCNHKETITVPQELFSGEQGFILFHLFISSFFEDNGGYVFSNTAINIEYTVLDNIVTIVGPQASIYWVEGVESN